MNVEIVSSSLLTDLCECRICVETIGVNVEFVSKSCRTNVENIVRCEIASNEC